MKLFRVRTNITVCQVSLQAIKLIDDTTSKRMSWVELSQNIYNDMKWPIAYSYLSVSWKYFLLFLERRYLKAEKDFNCVFLLFLFRDISKRIAPE